ncbi:MAG TPA: aminopeptidase, partial [Kofleriaceae bacterium]
MTHLQPVPRGPAWSRRATTASLGGVALALALSGCLMTRYLAQAAHGQLDLLGKARPIDKVVRDPNTPVRTAMLLSEIPAIKQYGRSYGLTIKGNYSSYAALGRPAAVWFVGAADPVAFKPVRWCFPIVGCFAGLGWFDEDEGVAHKLELDEQGYDTIIRPASAYSTGGWFPDPVLSTMLGGGDDALPGLANVILHESVHATVLVPDEPFFNESFASYVADALTDHWISVRFGPGSPEDLAWTLGQAVRLPRTARLLDTYDQLKKLY